MILLEHALLFNLYFFQWVRLKPNPIQTSDLIGLESVFSESPALIVCPFSKRAIVQAPLWHVTVTIAGMVYFGFAVIHIP